MSFVKLAKFRIHNLNYSALTCRIRKYSNLKPNLKNVNDLTETYGKLDKVLQNLKSKIIYNSLVDKYSLINKYRTIKTPTIRHYEEEVKRLQDKLGSSEPLPISLKYLIDETGKDIKEEVPETEESQVEDEETPHFPFKTSHEINVEEISSETQKAISDDVATELDKEIRQRNELQKDMRNWMSAYDNYDDRDLEEIESCEVNYGTPDPTVTVSKVPCGGCGALLHCKDTAIPGYIPSEIFKNALKEGGSNLEAITCQRCHFLKNYNVALEVQVSSDDYPKVLQTISQKQGIVILMVDLTDFPCSIWPGIGEIFNNKIPVVIVGNKVDLLPKDDRKYLLNIKQVLLDYVRLSGFATFNIKHTALISATTGYGIEDLITVLQSLYKSQNDFYIVGSTNVGKSSLFNALIRSDFCKSQAVDLIQKATTSIWPGTTLNLLKFPVKRPSGYRQFLRQKRLETVKQLEKEENLRRLEILRNTKDPTYATLTGHVEPTNNPQIKVDETNDSFSVADQRGPGIFKMGIYEKLPEYKYSRWCYDTPGVVQPDQIIHLLTTEELLLTLPKKLILPRSFCLQPNSTLFIGGLSRLDFLNGPGSVRLTVFASEHLPITVCKTEDADNLYKELLGTPLFKVPKGGKDRLAKWPQLELAKKFNVKGIHWKMSAIDVVLSNSGWIAITGQRGKSYDFQAWTPEQRGCHLRDCILPKSIALAGHRLKRNVAYKKHNFYLK